MNRYWLKLIISSIFVMSPFTASTVAESLVSVKQFGAVADARKIGEIWIGTDNSKAINACAEYCRRNGLTMFFPKGNYGVASTVWLTNPDKDGLKQASITVVGSNLGAYRDQSTSVNLCVLKNFKPGKIVEVKKTDRVVKEPYIVPVLGISNGRQVHIQGLGIQGANKEDLICGIAIGNISQLTSVRNCSISNVYAGIVFPGLRPSPSENVIDGNNDLLVVEQSTFDNMYNIICAGTQPFACEYRSNRFMCVKSVFTGTLFSHLLGQSRGSHKFSSNLFGSLAHSPEDETVYFDLAFNEITIDSCHFETGWKRSTSEVVVRSSPNGGAGNRSFHFAFTNNIVNFRDTGLSADKYKPIIDTMVGNRMIFQGNQFIVGTATRIKADGAVFIGNVFRLTANHDTELIKDRHLLIGPAGNVQIGLYDFNHFVKKNSKVQLFLANGTMLKEGLHYRLKKDDNSFEITSKAKGVIDKSKGTYILASYRANDAGKIKFAAWGGNRLNPPHGWRSRNLTLIANKIIGITDSGTTFEKTISQDFSKDKQ